VHHICERLSGEIPNQVWDDVEHFLTNHKSTLSTYTDYLVIIAEKSVNF